MREQMRVLLDVVIPRNYPEYMSQRVHVAEWIEGEKFSQSAASDVGASVNLGVITYLTQLLNFGFFHGSCVPEARHHVFLSCAISCSRLWMRSSLK